MKNFSLLIALVTVLTLLVGCGRQDNPKIVKDITLAAYTDNGDIYTDLQVVMDIGNMTLPSLELPVKHPKTHEVLGTISMLATMDGMNEIGLDVNLSSALRLQGGINAKLPNGSNIPVGGLGDTPVIELPIGNTSARVYIAIDSGVAMIGFGLPIKELDGVGSNVGQVNFFPTFMIKEVRGIAGVFTGSQSGQNGLACFADLSSVIDPDDHLEDVLQYEAYGARLKKSAPKNMFFINKAPRGRQKRKFDKKIYKLHRKRTRLHVK
ncbi:MAG: hypothetical protein ACOCUH_00730 [Bacteriovoracia bacterium]